MKVSEIKEKLDLGSKWKGMKYDNNYYFTFARSEININKEEEVYNISILSIDGYVNERFESIEDARNFIHNSIDL